MKKSIMLVLLALVSTVTFAQISWNAKVGMNVSNWSEGGDTKARVGYKIGGGMEYAFTDLWSIQSSLFLSSKGTKIDVAAGDITVNQVYLEMPMMGAARFNIADNTNIVVSAGPYIAYGIFGKTKENIADTKVNTFGDYDVKRFDLGLGVGVAAEFGQIIVGLDGQYGLTKVKSFGNSDPKNLNFSVSVGYKF